MTKEQREHARHRLENTIPIETPGTWYHEDMPAALDYIEQLEARAEALEKALIELSGHCDSCINFGGDKSGRWECDKVVADFSCWQFDQERYTDKPTPCQDKPKCFGIYRSPQSDAENCCNDCQYNAPCQDESEAERGL